MEYHNISHTYNVPDQNLDEDFSSPTQIPPTIVIKPTSLFSILSSTKQKIKMLTQTNKSF